MCINFACRKYTVVLFVTAFVSVWMCTNLYVARFAFSCPCTYVISVFLVMESNGFTGTLWNADEHLFGRKVSTHSVPASLSLSPIPWQKHTLHAVCCPINSVCVWRMWTFCTWKNKSSPKTPAITETYLHNVLLHIEAIISILDSSVGQTHSREISSSCFSPWRESVLFPLLAHTITNTNKPTCWIYNRSMTTWSTI